MPNQVVADPQPRSLVFPVLAADLQLLARWEASVRGAVGHAHHGVRAAFTSRWFPDGHMFIQEHRDAVIAVIPETLRV